LAFEPTAASDDGVVSDIDGQGRSQRHDADFGSVTGHHCARRGVFGEVDSELRHPLLEVLQPLFTKRSKRVVALLAREIPRFDEMALGGGKLANRELAIAEIEERFRLAVEPRALEEKG
jgi:hypothetical protein